MKIYENALLKKYNTFGLNYTADYLIHIQTEAEATSIFKGIIPCQNPIMILGGGSNILFISDYKGTILYPEISGIKIENTDRINGFVTVSAGAGVDWDTFVEWTVNKGFGGLENLSLIPGKVGATPIQNIGAYGVEVKDLITQVRTISTENGTLRIFENNECEFGYRNSIFKNELKGKYLVTRVYYKLTTDTVLNLSYGSLKDEVATLGDINLKNVRQAVINIRQSKLPDPEIIGNAGSFFKNPVVKMEVGTLLKNKFPDMPVYSDRDGYVKLASGWLIDKCEWKGVRRGDACVHDKQALVLVNYGNASGKELLDLSEEIKNSVSDRFGIDLEREVEIVGII
jgi:UDP-N-acetylmuramate dehydrogenase